MGQFTLWWLQLVRERGEAGGVLGETANVMSVPSVELHYDYQCEFFVLFLLLILSLLLLL